MVSDWQITSHVTKITSSDWLFKQISVRELKLESIIGSVEDQRKDNVDKYEQ